MIGLAIAHANIALTPSRTLSREKWTQQTAVVLVEANKNTEALKQAAKERRKAARDDGEICGVMMEGKGDAHGPSDYEGEDGEIVHDLQMTEGWK